MEGRERASTKEKRKGRRKGIREPLEVTELIKISTVHACSYSLQVMFNLFLNVLQLVFIEHYFHILRLVTCKSFWWPVVSWICKHVYTTLVEQQTLVKINGLLKEEKVGMDVFGYYHLYCLSTVSLWYLFSRHFKRECSFSSVLMTVSLW